MKRPSLRLWAALGLTAFAPATQAASVLAQWNFNDVGNATTAVDSVAGYVGTFAQTGGRTADGGGVSGGAGDFGYTPGGGTGRLNSSTAGFLSALNAAAGGQAVSITYWQNLSGTPSSTAFWANSPGATGGNRGMSAHSPWSNGISYFDTSGCCDPVNRINGALGATVGTWEMMSFVYDNGTKSIYRGTTLIASGTGANPLNTNFDAFYLGNAANGTEGMSASLDNITIWNGALTPAEIGALVPEPATGVLGLLAGLGMFLRRRRS